MHDYGHGFEWLKCGDCMNEKRQKDDDPGLLHVGRTHVFHSGIL